MIAIGTSRSARADALRSVTTAAVPSAPWTTVAESTFTYALSRAIDSPFSLSVTCFARRASLALFSAVDSQPPSASAASASRAATRSFAAPAGALIRRRR